MAIKYGVNATKVLNQSIPALSEQGEHKGRVQMLYDEYTLTADLAAADIIKMGSLLPAGARVVNMQLYFDDLDAAGGTVNVGWAASADAVEAASASGLALAVDVTSAGVVDTVDDYPASAGLFKKFASPVQIQVATVGDTDATTGTIKVAVFYVID